MLCSILFIKASVALESSEPPPALHIAIHNTRYCARSSSLPSEGSYQRLDILLRTCELLVAQIFDVTLEAFQLPRALILNAALESFRLRLLTSGGHLNFFAKLSNYDRSLRKQKWKLQDCELRAKLEKKKKNEPKLGSRNNPV